MGSHPVPVPHVVLSHGAFVLLVFLSEDMGHTKAYIVVLE